MKTSPALSSWIKFSMLNLCIVAFLGCILRYKIVFSLPFLDQKHILHAHSHFAFSGWITMTLMSLLVDYLHQNGQPHAFSKYKSLLIGNALAAYGMLLSFPFQGYGLFSIAFSTLSIVVSYFFMVIFWRDLQRIRRKDSIHFWFKAALVFQSVSSLGAFTLAFLMANHINHQNWYLSAVYFFLHFQYNGWFFFACMGLFLSYLRNLGIPISETRNIFLLFVLAAIPAYYLSALWMPMYRAVYILVVLSAAAQVIAFFLLVQFLFRFRKTLSIKKNKTGYILMILSCTALCIKLLLQLGSTHPALSQLAFGFRPIVIAYLHLVLLGVITLFLLGYISLHVF
ncbi:MAG TPA: hypothetical protein PLP34_07820, partial [Chitinophagaceae bacterium]|nr:hypothetical protein [Chitinophagaceae bacterium]